MKKQCVLKGRGFSRAETAPLKIGALAPEGQLVTIFVNIRPATAADLAVMIDLERSCPTAAHWDEGRYQELFHSGAPERLALVAEELPHSTSGSESAASPVLGFLVARHVASEWELENIVVAAKARRKGLGKRLLEALFARARQLGSDSVFLEVRASNAAARSLYEKAGFELTGHRKSYYADPPEDALLYRKHLS